jgi:lipopolysaccharide biosynthesis glycosyltransferase
MKRALVTLLDDGFYVGFEVFLKSFLAFNPWFSDDFVVIDVGLSEKTREKMREKYPKMVFFTPKYENYSAVNMKITAERLKKTYYTLDVFDLPYDRIVFMDMDMLILGDLREIFNFAGHIGGVRAYNRNADILQGGINTGLFVVNSEFLNEKTYKRLLEIARPGHNMPDQTVINEAFKGQISELRKVFNVEKRMINTRRFKNVIEEMRVLHFVGEKPWQKHAPGTLEAGYEPFEKLWREWRDK